MDTHTTKTRTAVLLAAAMITLGAATTAFAATPGSQLITMPTVTVGDIGNPANPAPYDDLPSFGSVSYEYQIGKYEVTNSQYAAFLNAVDSTGANTYNLYISDMSSSIYGGITWNSSSGRYEVKAGFDLKPVVYVSFYDAARFVNWLTTGDTENGLYVFSANGLTITSNPDHATSTGWAIASEDEWYKAAYYDPNKGGAGGYWAYPTQSDSISDSQANFYNGWDEPVLMEVGSFVPSAYGTFDQGGNVLEWNDTLIYEGVERGYGTDRVMRGGAFDGYEDELATSSIGSSGYPDGYYHDFGFRVVLLGQVPEPGTYAALAGLAMLVYAALRRR
ncbi:PEP-CTERM sorting domain-containing protein [Opitutaceae bacterium TAV4]|nr:PEP-CTERM sorting domain-containing protein [Opitutaceae bacterium TAV4]RRJ99895.1 PEP-CTERM sorting domain-containing protein [Opitutaceae bacterium TAV3]